MSEIVSNNCTVPDEKVNFVINIGIHVFILFCFLSVLFVMYISNIAKEALESELKEAIEHGIETGLGSIEGKKRGALKKVIKNLPMDRFINHYNKTSKPVDVNNKWLTKLIIYINVFLLLLIISGSYLLRWSCNQCVPLKSIIIENAIIFTFIGMVEILFFKFVAIKYIPVKPSTLITSSLNSLKNNIN
jgi:hypothetical protein